MFRVIREMKSFNFWDISFSILCTVILEKLSRDIKSSRLFTMAVVTLLEVFRVILCLLTKIFQVNFSHADALSKCVFTHQKLHARQDYRLIIAAAELNLKKNLKNFFFKIGALVAAFILLKTVKLTENV